MDAGIATDAKQHSDMSASNDSGHRVQLTAWHDPGPAAFDFRSRLLYSLSENSSLVHLAQPFTDREA